MDSSQWSYDEEAAEWLRRFSLSLDFVAQKGANFTKEEVQELLTSISSFNESIQHNDSFAQYLTSLRLAEELLGATLSRHFEDVTTNEEVPRQPLSHPDVENSSTTSPINGPVTDKDGKDELDSFSNSRRQAIESTMISNLDELPSLHEIIGLEEAKSALFEALVDPVQYSEWFLTSDLKPWKTILLYGPPGTGTVLTHVDSTAYQFQEIRASIHRIGKSALSHAVVREIKSQLYQVSSSDLISTWSGQSERLIRELFDHAITLKETAVIFIDEVDSLCRTRCSTEDDANRRVKTELLVQIQRLQSTSNVVLVCATNCPWDLDPAFMRRFEKKIYVGLPDYQARVAMLKNRLSELIRRISPSTAMTMNCIRKGEEGIVYAYMPIQAFYLNTPMDSSVSFEWLAEATNGFSGDDIRRLATELAYIQFRYYKARYQREGNMNTRKALSCNDVEAVLKSFSKSVEEHQLARFLQYKNK